MQLQLNHTTPLSNMHLPELGSAAPCTSLHTQPLSSTCLPAQVELMHMKHKLDKDTRLIKGLALDHGSRHPDMPKRLERCHILTCNLSLEYERSEVSQGNRVGGVGGGVLLVQGQGLWVEVRGTRSVVGSPGSC